MQSFDALGSKFQGSLQHSNGFLPVVVLIDALG
jgi:hypothetical protein